MIITEIFKKILSVGTPSEKDVLYKNVIKKKIPKESAEQVKVTDFKKILKNVFTYADENVEFSRGTPSPPVKMASKKAPAKKNTRVKKTTTKKTTIKKAPAKKSTTSTKTTTKKATSTTKASATKKPVTKKSTATPEKTTAKKTVTKKKTTTTKATAKKPVEKKVTAKKTAAKNTAVNKIRTVSRIFSILLLKSYSIILKSIISQKNFDRIRSTPQFQSFSQKDD